MNASRSDTGRKDRRPLALLLFALCILGIAGARQGGFFTSSGQAPVPQQIIWRDGSSGPGLYRAQAEPASEPSAATGANLPARLAPLFFQPIPINQADEELLTTIPGIGPVFARKIIEFREQQGRINAIEELDEVKGVGPAKLKILQAHLVTD